MTRTRRWITGAAAAVLLLLGGVAWFTWRLLPSDEALAAGLGARFEQATGIGLRVGAAHWALRPIPVVVLSDLATAQPRPITVRRVVLRPRLAALWQRRVAIEAVEIEGAVLPRASVRAFRGRWQASEIAGLAGDAWTAAEIPVERVRVRDAAWINRRDIALAYDADLRFDRGWRPREAEVRRRGVAPAARLRLEREGGQDRWRVLIDVGGGTWNGQAELRTLEPGGLRVTAQLEPKGVEVSQLLSAFRRRQAVEGRIEGRTELHSEGENVGELIRHLHTRTRFSMRPATLKGFDLARVVSPAGNGRGGQTVLDELSGTLDTQAAQDGTVLRYTGLEARSGVLTASGHVTVLNRRLDGEVAIDLVDGVVGVPLQVAGTLDDPQLSLTGGALAGAAVGSAVLPGVGTAIGARVGREVEKMLGDEDAKKKPPPAPAPKSR